MRIAPHPVTRTGDFSAEGFWNELGRQHCSRRRFLFLLAATTTSAVLFPGCGSPFNAGREPPPLREYPSPYPYQEVIALPLIGPGETEPVTRQQIEALAQATSTFYEKESLGKLHYSMRVLDWQTTHHAIDQQDHGKMLSDMAEAGDALIDKQAGADMEHNQTRIYIMGVNLLTFDARGWGEKREPVLYNRIWINSHNPYVLDTPRVLMHELGETLGLHHDDFLASRLLVPDDYTPANVKLIDGLGDSLMGNGEEHLNVCHKVALGWITGERIQTVLSTDSGFYTLVAHDLDPPIGLVALRIPFQAYDPASTSWKWQFYYVQYNTPILINGQFTKGGLEFRMWDEEVGSPTKQVCIAHADRDPNQFFPVSPDLLVDDGDYLYDRVQGITIQQVHHSDSNVTVHVLFDHQ